MFVFVGLGNPGEEYRETRHNVGFMAVDKVCKDFSFSKPKSKFHGLVCEGVIAGKKVLAVKPMTFMNRSGLCIGELVKFYKIQLDSVFVFHDELDVKFGRVRVKQGGGAAGHNGLRSIDVSIGKDYHRIRIGIGHPGSKEMVSGYVLSGFAKEDQLWLNTTLTAISQYCPLLIEENNDAFANSVNNELAL